MTTNFTLNYHSLVAVLMSCMGPMSFLAQGTPTTPYYRMTFHNIAIYSTRNQACITCQNLPGLLPPFLRNGSKVNLNLVGGRRPGNEARCVFPFQDTFTVHVVQQWSMHAVLYMCIPVSELVFFAIPTCIYYVPCSFTCIHTTTNIMFINICFLLAFINTQGVH